MHDTELQQFFQSMVRRFRKETHLSDLTYVALEVIPGFKRDFIQFFDPELTGLETDIEVTREFALADGDGQPDLVLQCEAWDLIVENKLWDRNYHFDQYGKKPLAKGRPLPRVALIANHIVVPSQSALHWKIRHWNQFVEHFEKKSYQPFDKIFAAYLAYVKEICVMTEFTRFRFDAPSLFAATHFVRMIERALRTTSSTTYEISVNVNKKGNFGESWSGYWFTLKPSKSQDYLSLFFGIDFSFEPELPAIGVHVHRHENSNHFQQIVQKLKDSQSYKRRLSVKDGMLQMNMLQDRFDTLNNESAKEKQLEILKGFLVTCCDDLLRAIA